MEPPRRRSEPAPTHQILRPPREKQLTKKRKCNVCKETGHVRNNCPSHKHSKDVANTSLTPHWELMH
ncbi:hypothetical protein CMV_026484 [Castanea mollissima]|uniref:CCHC-type domain-containing protein n=1 Tax=Castanea mollissima TaxID=60419 RepID=A0A8J4QCY1_9ROSI|nr:hypothetical protein CMV_026484 [Castanea mollissima]